jgi:type IV pilus assembly protein PilC
VINIIKLLKFELGHQRIKQTQLTQVLRQLATLLQAKIPLVAALTTLAQVYKKPLLQRLLVQLKIAVAGGISLSQAMQEHPHYFAALTCQLIKAGEHAAALPQVLTQVCIYQEKSQQLTARIKKALFYPITVLSVAMIITVGLLLFIVPQFEQLFASFGATLPWFTRMVLAIAACIKQDSGWFLFSLFMITIICYHLAKKFPAMSACLEKIKLGLPLFGRIQLQAITARFTRTLAMTTHAGLPLLASLSLSARVTNHQQFAVAIDAVRNAVACGETLAQALLKSQRFSPLVIEMVHVGEQSGQLSEMLQHVALWYEAQIDETVAMLSQCLEPAIMLILGIVIGCLVLAMYLPVFQLGNVV